MSLKIGIVSPYNIYRFGGVQEATLAHAKELKKRGHGVVVIAPQPKAIAVEPFENVLTIGKSAEIKTPFKTTADFSYKADKKEIDELFQKNKFDVMHFHEPWVPLLSKQLLTEAKKRNIATVATFHAMLPEGVTAKTIKKLMLPYVKATIPKLDELVAVSESASKNIKSLTKREIHIIPNAIDTELYDPKKYEAHTLTIADSPVILYVGRLETRKGVEYLIKAVADISGEGKTKPKLILAGDGPLKDELTDLAYTHGIYDVHFLGFIETEEKLQLLKGCDVFCSPALYGESFGIVLLEAMAMGKATVAGNNPGYSGVLVDEGAEGLVDPKDTKKFSKLLDKALNDKKFNTKLSTWGLKEVKKYTYPVVVDQYVELYNRLTESK